MTRPLARALRGLLLIAAVAALPQAALAQGGARGEARERFERGLELFEEGRYDAALAEFERAYEVAPTPAVLYNIARVYGARGDAVSSVRYYERFLERGGARDDAERLRVEQELETQRGRIAELVIESNAEDAVLAIDGVDVGRLPLEAPLPVAAGEHVVSVRSLHRGSQNRSVQLAGGTRETVRFVFDEAPRGALRIESAVPGVEVRVDGRAMGSTPLQAPLELPAGRHLVRGERPGYAPLERDVDIVPGSERTLDLTLRPAQGDRAALARLRLALPDVPYALRIDGDAAIGLEHLLPEGPHTLEIQVEERQPFRDVVTVAQGMEPFAPHLAWTTEARDERRSAARRRRRAGVSALAVGVAAIGAGVSVLAWNESRSKPAEREYRTLRDCREMAGPGGDPSLLCPDFDTRAADNDAERESIALTRGLSWATLALGAVTTPLGLWLWTSAESNEEIDRSASVVLGVRPGALELRGAF